MTEIENKKLEKIAGGNGNDIEELIELLEYDLRSMESDPMYKNIAINYKLMIAAIKTKDFAQAKIYVDLVEEEVSSDIKRFKNKGLHSAVCTGVKVTRAILGF